MRRWWRERTGRERAVLGAGGLLALLLLGWAWVWDPLARAHAEARAALAADLARLEALRPRAARLRSRPSPASADSRSLLALVDAGLREAGLAASLRRLEPLGERRVRLSFEQVAFDAAARFLEDLAERHGTVVRELSARRGEGAGIVDLRVTLERP